LIASADDGGRGIAPASHRAGKLRQSYAGRCVVYDVEPAEDGRVHGGAAIAARACGDPWRAHGGSGDEVLKLPLPMHPRA
jgi:hypothetical protein